MAGPDVNLSFWRAYVEEHAASGIYKIETIVCDPDALTLAAADIRLIGDVTGVSLLHLQCHRPRHPVVCATGCDRDESARLRQWWTVKDSQIVKTTESGGVQGYDAGKKVKGRKRHAMVDTDGRAFRLHAHAAGIQDADGAGPLLRALRPSWPFVRLAFAHSGCQGPRVAAASTIRVEIVRKPGGQVGSTVHAADGWSGASSPGSTTNATSAILLLCRLVR